MSKQSVIQRMNIKRKKSSVLVTAHTIFKVNKVQTSLYSDIIWNMAKMKPEVLSQPATQQIHIFSPSFGTENVELPLSFPFSLFQLKQFWLSSTQHSKTNEAIPEVIPGNKMHAAVRTISEEGITKSGFISPKPLPVKLL